MATRLSDGYAFDTSELNGQLFPWHQEYARPHLIDIEGAPFVPIFANEILLDTVMAALGVTAYDIKEVNEGQDFLDSLTEAGIKACFNVYCIEDGKIRYTEIHMDWQPNA